MPLTRIDVRYPAAQGRIRLRGSCSPLSWRASLEPKRVDGSLHAFEVELPRGELLEFKAMRDEKLWSRGRNFTVLAGESVELHPYFERDQGVLEEDLRQLASPELGRDVRFRMFLPPSYFEHTEKRYPVLFAQDGQSLFTDHPDPIDGQSWRLEATLNELYELGVIEEAIVVGVYTDVDRTDILSPIKDREYGGGLAPRYLEFLVSQLKPYLDRTFRTRPDVHHTAVIGSSMGGLFSFFAAWTRPDVFGKAACLSGSFWWADRGLVHQVKGGACPAPRPLYYLDSGAALNAFENDANLRDGLHHTSAMRDALVQHCYEAGSNLFCFTYPGESHNNASWASRIAVPLQLLFPHGS